MQNSGKHASAIRIASAWPWATVGDGNDTLGGNHNYKYGDLVLYNASIYNNNVFGDSSHDSTILLDNPHGERYQKDENRRNKHYFYNVEIVNNTSDSTYESSKACVGVEFLGAR